MTLTDSTLVIVESPSKAKTIGKYLGSGYTVIASYGHIRDLPSKNGCVEPDNNYAMHWDTPPESVKHVKAMTDALKTADTLILATDPDREGEAISWHILEVLQEKNALRGKEVQRVTFTEITPRAVREAMAKPRQIDDALVQAYLARRALDYLVGFTLSPVLWRKLPGSRSAGRVQSVALRIVVERELEIEEFKPEEYWSVDVAARNSKQDAFNAQPVRFNDKALRRRDITNAEAAHTLTAAITAAQFTVASVEAKPVKRHPAPPFTTSTLQQEASRKLGFSASRTMQTAQKLYEGVNIGGETVGLITYMRTDGVSMSAEAIDSIRKLIGNNYGAQYVPETPRLYKAKAKNAQEAHEAIRPTDILRHPSSVPLEGDMARLYDLIWKRTVACQMAAAVAERTTADITDAAQNITLRATGSVPLFDGFLSVYVEGRDDDTDEDSRLLPPLHVGEAIGVNAVNPAQHFTEPPPRYGEASLVKRMEELGIGRPSTYASTMSVLRDRAYVRIEKNRLIPEDKGRIVTHFLQAYFAKYVEYDFTAALEENLDKVSEGALPRKTLLDDFWLSFKEAINEASALRITQVIDHLDAQLAHHLFPPRADGQDPRHCPACGDAHQGRLSLKLSKFGAFTGCTRYPECSFTRPLSGDDAAGALTAAGPKELGADETGESITVRTGRFGPYVQAGNGKTARRASIPKALSPETLTLHEATMLLSLPREVGVHPQTELPVVLGAGRFGPYVLHNEHYHRLPNIQAVLNYTLAQAVQFMHDNPPKERKTPARAPMVKKAAPKKAAVKKVAVKKEPAVKKAATPRTRKKEVAVAE